MSHFPSFRIELSIRAGNMAKDVLDLTAASSTSQAKLMLTEIARDLKDIREFVKNWEDRR